MAADVGIFVIIDGSGSMSGVKKEVVTGINEFITEQQAETQKLGESTEFTLTSFDTNVNEVYIREDIALVQPVTINDTFLGGGTALLDAIGRTLSKAKDDQAPRNICVIYTDGEENSSREYDKEQIEDLIQELDDTGRWQFIYLGAEFADFQEDAGAMAVASAGTYSGINTSKQNVNRTFKNMSAHTSYTRGASAQDWAAINSSGDVLTSTAAAAGIDWNEPDMTIVKTGVTPPAAPSDDDEKDDE